MSKLLINESPLQIQPSLAKAIGLHEAIFLQQLHYWIRISRFIRNERKWVYNTYEEWLNQLKYLSLPTLKRAIKSLKTQKLLYVERFDRLRSNQVNYYSINYDTLNEIEEGMGGVVRTKEEIESNSSGGSSWSNPVAQHEPIGQVKMNSSSSAQDEPMYTREYQENTQENTKGSIKKKIIDEFDIKTIELPNNVTRKLWVQFVEMRISIKKPLSENAAVLLVKKLEGFGGYANQSLENSIIASYQTVYPPKDTAVQKQFKSPTAKRFGRYGDNLQQTNIRDLKGECHSA